MKKMTTLLIAALTELALADITFETYVWSAAHNGNFLYVKTNHRHRVAHGENLYELNLESLKLEHRGVHFAKEELVREDKQLREALERLSKEFGEANTVQPATRPESKSEGGDKSQPEVEGHPR